MASQTGRDLAVALAKADESHALRQSFVPPWYHRTRRPACASGCGAAVDGLLVTSCCVAYRTAGSVPDAVMALLYLLLRDSFGGQSIGKFLAGQAVIHVDTAWAIGSPTRRS